MRADGDAPQDADAAAKAAPGIEDALRSLGAEGRAGLQAAGDAVNALRALVAADIALARSALVHSLVFAALALVFCASGWLLLMAALVAALQAAGLSWLGALLIAATLSIAIAAGAGIIAMRHFRHTQLAATRRQLARLGFGAGSPAAQDGRTMGTDVANP